MIRHPDVESSDQRTPGSGSGRRRPRWRRRWQRPAVGPLARSYAFVVVSLRYAIVAGWLIAAVLAVLYLPSLSAGGGVGDLVPTGSAALRAEADATRLFRVPMSAPVAVVQHSAKRLPVPVQEKAGRSALNVDRGAAARIPGLAGALPVANTSGLFPGSRQSSTTVITFLYFTPATSMAAQVSGGEMYAHRYAGAPRDQLAGVTGPIPARYEQGQIIQRYLPWVEVATVLAIFLIVGWHFRSFGAPLATLACAGTSYLIAVHGVAWVAARMGVTIPPDLEPVLVVLLLGVTTDYCVFYLSGMRAQLADGQTRVAAARHTTAEYTPIIVAAGIVVAAGTAALVVARISLLRAFGPGLALTVLTAMVVSVTLAPALIAIFGGLLFKPGPRRLRQAGLNRDGAGEPARGRRRWLPGGSTLAEHGARFAATRPVALLIVLGCLVALIVGALGATKMRLGSPIIRELPASAEAARAEAAASQGFVPGILAPTDVLVFGAGLAAKPGPLRRLQRELARQPDVAGVVGPADLPAATQPSHLMVTASGNAARLVVIDRTDPLGPAAVSGVRALERSLPGLARSAGLSGVRFEVGGETAVTAESIDATTADMARIAVAVLAVTLLLLAVFLRAVLAPVYLLAASILALLAALGVTVWIFQGLLGYDGLVYFVPFAVGVLLVSLGSDYNIFVVGRIWEEARRRPLREAVAVAAPKASQAITTAGIALAASFAVLALIPLDQFRELAAAMALGVIIDAFIVRSLMVPALVALFGRAGRWPGGRSAP
ncbi:MAG TPA: MMPL family transporter [Streptosporangiaceae bacterium]